MSIGYIYLLTNRNNGKSYIGFTTNPKRRKSGHCSRAKTGSHKFILSNAIRKHGWETFDWQIIDQHEDAQYAKTVLEPKYIKEYNTYYKNGKGYNMTWGGEGTLGYRRTPEEIKAMRLRNRGRKPSPEQCERISERTRGENNPNYGKIASDFTKEKISAGVKRAYVEGRLISPFKSPEHAQRVRQMSKNRVYTPETRLRMSIAQRGRKGKPHTEEHKQYMRKLMTGRVFSEATRRKMPTAHAYYLWTIRSLKDDNVYEIWSLRSFCQHFGASPATFDKMLRRKENGIKIRKSRCLWEPISKILLTKEMKNSLPMELDKPWRIVNI